MAWLINTSVLLNICMLHSHKVTARSIHKEHNNIVQGCAHSVILGSDQQQLHNTHNTQIR